MLALADLREAVERGEIDTVLTVLPDMYGRLLGKRITGRFFLEETAEHGMHACDYLLACDMEMDPVPGYKFASWETGYGDFRCVPDLGTLRRAAWLPRSALVLCDLRSEPGDETVEVAPRRILQRQLARARDLGFTPMAGAELEFYLFDETYDSARAKRFHDLRTGGAYVEDYHLLQGTRHEGVVGEIRRALEASGIPVEFSKGEWGPGQQEINLRYSEALIQADRTAIYKHAAKEIAAAQGKSITFMAKWDAQFAGSSMHLHLSLWDERGERNRFAGDGPSATGSESDLFRWFLGGWMARARELSVCWAPYPTSYKRYRSGSFAPTTIAWSRDNRTAGFRVVGSGPSLRIECRLPGADANVYLVTAAGLAAGLDGIDSRTEPPRAFTGDAYQAAELPRVPATLGEAIGAFGRSDFARAAFGEAVVEHYLHFFRSEERKFDEVVTCWERERYFERA